MKKIYTTIAITVLTVGIAVISVFAVKRANTPSVTVISAQPRSIVRTIPCNGTVTAKNEQTVTYDQTLYPEEIIVSAGERVKDGDTLMIAKNSGMRTVKVRAECDGIVTLISAALGKEARAGMPLFVISQTDSMQVKTQVSEKNIASLNVGQSARITGNGFSGREYSGEVVKISSLAEQSAASGTVVGVTVDIDGSDDNILPGMSAKVYISVETGADEPVVPYSAIEYSGSDAFVYVADDNGNVTRTAVKIGIEGDEGAQIESGIGNNDRVVEDWQSLCGKTRVSVNAK